MIVLAVDQSTAKCGYAVYDTIEERFIKTGAHDIPSNPNVDARISYVKQWLIKLIAYYKPQLVISEDIQYQNNQRTYKVLAELLGVICNSFYETKIEYQVVPPVTWKAYCGIKSKSRKEQKAETMQTIREKFGINAGEDEADAIGLLSYGCRLFE